MSWFVFQVISATGVCGSNTEYVLDLCVFLRANSFKDDHLFELEMIILEKLKNPEESPSESNSSSEFDTDSIWQFLALSKECIVLIKLLLAYICISLIFVPNIYTNITKLKMYNFW